MTWHPIGRIRLGVRSYMCPGGGTAKIVRAFGK